MAEGSMGIKEGEGTESPARLPSLENFKQLIHQCVRLLQEQMKEKLIPVKRTSPSEWERGWEREWRMPDNEE